MSYPTRKQLILSTGAIVLGYVIYKWIKSSNDNVESRKMKKVIKIRRTLLELLHAFDEDDIEKEDLINTLRKLGDQCAFTEIQEQIRNLNYLPKIANIVKYPDQDVQCQAALLVNNLSMNVQNQLVLKESIPFLVEILCKNIIRDDTITLFTAVLCALTNLTTLDDSHVKILPHLPIFCELLMQCEIVQIKLQVLKVFVNISTNKKNCENDFELAALLIKSIESFINPNEDKRILLRAICCCANVLGALHSRWQQAGDQPYNITTPEFVSQKLHDNLVKLSTHVNEEIHQHAMRALKALRSPPPLSSVTPPLLTSSPASREQDMGNNNGSPNMTLDKMDLLDFLKI